MLNNFSFFGSGLNVSKTNSSNKNILKKSNYIFYQSAFFFYKIISIFIQPFQRKFINVYTTYLQTNRLPLRIVPKSVQKLLVYIVDINSWILFFKRIKNNVNIYIMREKKHSLLHRLWCLYFRNDAYYYYELNVKKKFSKEIANFYYLTRITDTHGNMLLDKKHKYILFYFLNKVVINNYPYFYWTYVFVYNKYQYNNKAVNTSQHIRSNFFFFFVRAVKIFENAHFIRSFSKLTFNTFKGAKTTIKMVGRGYIEFIDRKLFAKDNVLHPTETHVKLFERNYLAKYNDFFEKHSTAITYKFFINTVIYRNFYYFMNKNFNKLVHDVQDLKITWYNKIHNSIINVTHTNVVLFLRAARHFNKGRYSRNRQLYRTGVYWCIWLNVVIVYSLHFYFYRVVFSFGYLWFPLGIMILSIFSSRLYKYRYYSFDQLVLEFKEFNNFVFYLISKIKNIYRTRSLFLLNKLGNFYKNYIYLFIKLCEMKVNSATSFFRSIFF